MPELGPYGSVRGAAGNSRPYRECRPITTVRLAPGPASESLQGRNPRGMGRGAASAMGIWAPRVDRSMQPSRGEQSTPRR
jgi:hypothetical protein